ncbi:MAG TPA: hypothetical protein VHB48_21350 [Chitinophagaceae bacterium]|nr:hypothetical protein [Chitinophagaceae bacterium]
MVKTLHTIKTIACTAVMLAAGYCAGAQSKYKVGFVRDSLTLQPLKGVLVTNENNHKLTHTDDKGFFRIEAYNKHILFFDKENYHFDTLRYNLMTDDTVTIYLVQLPNILAGVTVTARGLTKYQQDSIKRRMDFESVAGPKPSVVSKSNSGAGVGINLDPLLKKSDKSKRKAYATFDEIEKTNYIDYRFSRDLVAGYTGLRGDDLDNFVDKYRPTYEWLRAHTGEDEVFFYVNEKLKEFNKHRH